MSLEEVIAKLEAATEGSPELDRRIRDVLGLPAMLVPPDGGDEAYPYTTSLDAALSLVQPDHDCMVQIVRGSAYSQVWKGGAPHYEGSAKSPALALVIASLKARAVQASGE